MQTATDKTVLKENVSMLRLLGLQRPLVPIEEYAAREGVSVDIVEQCVKLGILQTRKFRDKTFVVDTLFNLHSYISENPDETSKPIERAKQVKKIFELVRKATPQPSTKTEEPTTPGHSKPIEKPSRPVHRPQIKRPEVVAESTKKIEKPVQIKQKPATAKKPQENFCSLEVLLAAQAKSRRIWQIVALSSVAAVCVLLFVGLLFYADYKVQLSRFNRTYTIVQSSLNEAGQISTTARKLQNELDRSNAELGRLRRVFERSRVQVRRLESELDTANLELERTENDLVKTRTQLENVLNELAGSQ
jgi:hypothetical protein